MAIADDCQVCPVQTKDHQGASPEAPFPARPKASPEIGQGSALWGMAGLVNTTGHLGTWMALENPDGVLLIWFMTDYK